MHRMYRGWTAIAFVILAGVVGHTASPDTYFTVDKRVTPIRRELPRFKDGRARVVAAIADATGAQQEFVEDEVVVATNNTELLTALLKRWSGTVLATYKPVRKGEVTRRLVRINPDLARLADLEAAAQEVKFKPQAAYRATTARGLRLLAAVASEKKRKKAAGDSEKAADYMDTEPNWLPYRDTVTPATRERFGWLDKTLSINCGYLLRQEVSLLRQIVEGGPGAGMAEQQLLEGLAQDDCAPPLPTFTLTNSLVLPEVDAGSDFTYVLNPPANIAPGFTADIIASRGGHTSHAPLGGTLYGGSVYLNTDGKQLALATYPTFVVPECGRTETFTIRLTHAAGTTDFEVTLPVRLEIPGLGIRTFNFGPGANVSIPLCAAGDRGAMQWSWIQQGGDPFPGAGLSLVTNADGTATITGRANAVFYAAQGALQVQQGSRVASKGIQIVIAVGFAPILGTACAQHKIAPETAFDCDLPRPLGYPSSTWTIGGGTLPAGVTLVQHGLHWKLEGTVPFWWSQCPICEGHDSVGVYTATANLTVPGFTGTVATREVTIDVGIPFSMLTQNTIQRPSGFPTIANTADDNQQRMDILLNRINNGTFDIVALQEVFDEEQRDQLSLGVDHATYDLAWGPDEADFDEESGVATAVKGSPNNLWGNTHNEVFAQSTDSDSWANKGFNAVSIQMGVSPRMYVINTHLQAAYDFDDQHSDVRRAQLEQIMAYVNSLPDNVPVVLIGDLNIVGGSTEYQDRMGDVLAGFVDPVAAAFGNAALPFTNDKTRNAYGHFWQDEHHILEHELEDIALSQGTVSCLIVGTAVGLPGACLPPIAHPTDQNRLDHILIRQGTEYELEVTGVQMEDVSAGTDLCRNRFRAQFTDPGHGNISCYMSDHFGLSATLRLRRP